MIAGLKVPARRIRSFIGRYAWIARDGLRGKLALVATITGLSMAAAAVTGLSLGLSGKILNVLQSGEPLQVPFTGLSLEKGGLIVFAASSLSVLLALASYAAFYARLKTRGLARAYYVRVSGRLLDLVEHRTAFISPRTDHEIGNVRMMIRRNAKHMSRSLEKIVQMLQPGCYALAAVVTASYLNFELSLVSYFFMLFLIGPLYRKSSEFNENSRMFFQNATAEMSRTMNAYVKFLEVSSFRIGKMKPVGEHFQAEASVKDYLDRFDRLRLAPVRMVLVMSLFMAVMVGMGMLGVGYILMFEKEGIGTALAFMGALIVLLKNLQSLGTTLASLNRFYPQTVNFLAYHDSLLAISESSCETLPGSLTLGISDDKRLDSADNIVIRPGDPVSVVCDRRLNRSNLSYIGGTILEACGIDATCRIEFATKATRPFPLTIEQYLGGCDSREETIGRQRSVLKEFGVNDEVERLPDGWQTVIDEEVWARLSPELASLLLILPLSVGWSQVVLVDFHLVQLFSDEKVHGIWRLFRRCYLFVVSNSADRILEGVSAGFIIEDERVSGGGSREWIRRTGVDFEYASPELAGMDDDEDLDDM